MDINPISKLLIFFIILNITNEESIEKIKLGNLAENSFIPKILKLNAINQYEPMVLWWAFSKGVNQLLVSIINFALLA